MKIIENCDELNISKQQEIFLIDKNLIYKCDECCDTCHCNDNLTIDDIESELHSANL